MTRTIKLANSEKELTTICFNCKSTIGFFIYELKQVQIGNKSIQCPHCDIYSEINIK